MRNFQITDTVLMRRPKRFYLNKEALSSNNFYDHTTKIDELSLLKEVHNEFDSFVSLLKDSGVNVVVVEDQRDDTPDSVFPNNWFSTHKNGDVFLFPLQMQGRRVERCFGVFERLKSEGFKIDKISDLSFYENEGRFLESTGSMVFDRVNKKIYAALSTRTNEDLLKSYASLIGYDSLAFHSYDMSGALVYHTNVMMSLGVDFAVVCLESVKDDLERKSLKDSLESSGREVVAISLEQMHSFAGNVLQLRSNNSDSVLVLSERANDSLSLDQLNALKKYTKLLVVPIDYLERLGGGGVRCMMAEIFLEKN